jgi:uncharacterized protein
MLLTHRSAIHIVAAALLSCFGPALSAQDGPQKLAAIRLNAGIHNIQAEVARTPEQRSIGLMNRPSMGANDGMLFVFDDAATQCFWMKNTLIPLSIAFVADDGRIEQIADMPPKTLESTCSSKPVRLVLEMNQGWFAKRGVKAGDRLGGGPFKP